MGIQRKSAVRAACCLVAALALVACGGGDDEPAQEESDDIEVNVDVSELDEEKLERSVKQLADSFTGGEDAVEVVDHKALKDILPTKVAGMTRTSASAERKGAMGFNVAQASAEYRAEDGDGLLSLSIDDIGGAGALAQLGLDMIEFEEDTETESGFKRTGEYKGYRSIEQMQSMGGRSLSEMTVFVGERFIVRIDAQDVPFERVREVADGIDLDALAEMATAADAG
ncbi:MAG: hypothetical protein AAFN78_02450 [Pseudomonadota bacterium]